jgi:4-hydroxybenzoate polyprenyltransferase
MAVAGSDDGIRWSRFGGQLGLVLLAMVLARTVAMLSNRLLDREIDRRNPRTATRAIPSGGVSTGQALGTLAGCAAGFVVTCGFFAALYGNWWPVFLAVPVLCWIGAYPLAKRFTSLSHLWLGSALALSPLAAALAIDPPALGRQPALWLLSGVVLCWVAGFDVIYALQDLDVDRAQGLHSLPARLGWRGALRVSRLLHGTAALLLVVTTVIDPRLGAIFGLGAVITCALLVLEHATVSRSGTSRLSLAFLTLNGLISCAVGGLGIVDVMF